MVPRLGGRGARAEAEATGDAPGSGFEIRELRAVDRAPVERLWALAGVVPAGSTAGAIIDRFGRMPDAVILVAERPDGSPDCQVGAAAIAEVGNGREGLLHCVACHSDVQRQGLGRSLVATAGGWLLTRGVECVRVRVEGNNIPARAFYLRLGFVEVGPLYFTKALRAGA